jgi:hypothetical protein
LKIIKDLTSITEDEKIDRYCRGLIPYIWGELCTKAYKTLDEVMNDAERVEAAKIRKFGKQFENKGVSRGGGGKAAKPMYQRSLEP